MRVLTLSPSIVDRFYALRTGKSDKWGVTTQSFIKDLLTRREMTESASKGTAYHLLFENGLEKYRTTLLEASEIENRRYCSGIPNGLANTSVYAVYEEEFNVTWIFNEAEASHVQIFRDTFPDCQYEIWCQKEYRIKSLPVVMRMRLDAVDGLDAGDIKTSKYMASFEERLNSFQWKCYMDALPELQTFTFHQYQWAKATRNIKYQAWTLDRTHIIGDELENEIQLVVEFLQQYPQVIEKRTKEIKL